MCNKGFKAPTRSVVFVFSSVYTHYSRFSQDSWKAEPIKTSNLFLICTDVHGILYSVIKAGGEFEQGEREGSAEVSPNHEQIHSCVSEEQNQRLLPHTHLGAAHSSEHENAAQIL